MANELDGTLLRWTAKRRAALVLSILKGETSPAEAARTAGATWPSSSTATTAR